MKFPTAAISLVLVSALGGCVIVADGDDKPAFTSTFDPAVSSPGTVFGAEIVADSITFLVSSNGCTDASFFAVDVDRRGDQTFAITLDRIRTDNCRALVPEGVDVSFTFQELGIPDGASVIVRNTIRRGS
ncbi:MAG: hypothetical protein AAFR00_05760 [Pseudomonadota bacterium]